MVPIASSAAGTPCTQALSREIVAARADAAQLRGDLEAQAASKAATAAENEEERANQCALHTPVPSCVFQKGIKSLGAPFH